MIAFSQIAIYLINSENNKIKPQKFNYNISYLLHIYQKNNNV